MTIDIEKIVKYLNDLLTESPKFTGKLEMNFRDGDFKDIHETKRTRSEEIEVSSL